jgi:hypothetical protein
MRRRLHWIDPWRFAAADDPEWHPDDTCLARKHQRHHRRMRLPAQQLLRRRGASGAPDPSSMPSATSRSVTLRITGAKSDESARTSTGRESSCQHGRRGRERSERPQAPLDGVRNFLTKRWGHASSAGLCVRGRTPWVSGTAVADGIEDGSCGLSWRARCGSARADAFGGDAAVVVVAAIGAGTADASAMRHDAAAADRRFSSARSWRPSRA